jgi:ornithine cyclodeaminase/alanine dehydrogenase-like protein (mu-crystallin family)
MTEMLTLIGEICRLHVDALSRSSDMESVTIEDLNKKHIEEFADWFRDYVSVMLHGDTHGKFIAYLL